MKQGIFVFIFGFIVTVFGFAQADSRSAATINLIRTEQITVGQLRAEVEPMERYGGRALTQSERLQILDVMINERLVLQAAERDRVIVSENEINGQVQELRNNMAQQLGRQPTDAEFAQAVRNESGLEVAAFREELRRHMTLQKYLFHKKGDLINSIRPPTEQEIQAQFNLVRRHFVRPETIRFSMILVPHGTDEASRTGARELANQLAAEIGTNPARFDAVAALSGPNSGFRAGDAGFLPRNNEAMAVVGADFMNAAFRLRHGEVSGLIEGAGGFQIIKITEKYEAKNLELGDIFQLGTRITVRDYIGRSMYFERQQAILNQATQELVTELRAGRGTVQIHERNISW
ncbi:MAG: peptidyl-prolyl cis-trans isomerase [Spirochaetes bacterium]|nr:peptidyl-prolyl cis-trans isomerase [Spirochaetota bacterium]